MEAFRLDLQAAIELRDASFSRRLDAEFMKAGGQIRYAIDAAILNYLFREKPSRQSISKDGESASHWSNVADRRYLIFGGPRNTNFRNIENGGDSAPDSNDETLTSVQNDLRQILLWYLVDGRTPSGQSSFSNLLLLRGHATEARNLYDRIVEQFGKQQQRLVSLNAHARQIEAILTRSEEDSISERESQADLLQELAGLAYDISDPHDKFSRINDLIRRRQIIGLKAAASNPAFDSPEFRVDQRHVFQIEVEHSKSDLKDELWSWWGDVLHGRLPKKYADLDRQALSSLDRINRALDPHKARVVLFTDNEQIIDAGSSYFPFEQLGGELATLSFSDLYLRHPRCLLTDSEFFRPSGAFASDEEAATMEVNGWLNTLLDETFVKTDAINDEGNRDGDNGSQTIAQQWLESRASAQWLRERGSIRKLKSVLTRNPRIHTRFAGQWAGYLTRLKNQYEADTPILQDRLEELVAYFQPQRAEDVSKFIKEVRAKVKLLTEESWSTFFNTAADTGLELIDLPGVESRGAVWPVPAIFLQGNAEIQKVVEALWYPAEFRRDPNRVLDQIKKLARKQTLPSSYIHALCYGLMFAYADRWPLTALLAMQALQIVRQLEASSHDAVGHGVAVNGREASYLLAVATRIESRTTEQRAEAHKLLREAMDSPRDIADSGEERRLSGIRFKVEEIALDTAEAVAKVRDSDEISKAVGQKDIVQIRNRIVEAFSIARKCSIEQVRVHSEIALRSEYFFSLFGDLSPDEKKVADGYVVRSFVQDQLRDLQMVYGNLGAAPLRDRSLLRLGAAAFGQFDVLPLELREGGLLEEIRENGASVRPIDRRRIERIEKLVESLL